MFELPVKKEHCSQAQCIYHWEHTPLCQIKARPSPCQMHRLSLEFQYTVCSLPAFMGADKVVDVDTVQYEEACDIKVWERREVCTTVKYTFSCVL